MAKTESTFLNMVITLMVIAGIASLALGGVYNLTKEPIRLAKKAKAEAAIKAVVPDFDSLYSFKYKPESGEDSLTVHEAYMNNSHVGTAIASYSNKGYDPTQIQVMVGFLPDGSVENTSVVQHKETPGLGTKMEEDPFKNQFKGINPAKFDLRVKKDGGDVDAITAATITSRAFSDAVERAYQSFQKIEGGTE